MKPYDLAFIGFGAAAMSLIARLAQADWPGSLVVIEPEAIERNDRTWCGWGPNQHPFSDQLTQTWSRWAVSQAQASITREAPETPYEMLHAGVVRERTRAMIEARSDWACLANRALAHSHAIADHGWQLSLNTGEQISAQWVLDARPPALSLKRPWLWQSFLGVEVKGPNFQNNDTVRLMDFVDANTPWPTFFYELPISANHRLIELTQFVPEPSDMNALQIALDDELKRRGIDQSAIIRQESGHLPMAPIAHYNHDQWLRIGAAGGSMRPATGYAFHSIQRWAQACAHTLLTQQQPTAPQRSQLLDWLDGVFLESLWRRPEQASQRFVTLFEQTPPAALTRFLMGRASGLDIARVLLALPKGPMIRAAIAHTLRRG